jgi:hypothetical protein
MFATVATLVFVPTVFMRIRKKHQDGKTFQPAPAQATR